MSTEKLQPRPTGPGTKRRTFGELAGEALRLWVHEARFAEARWKVGTNIAWVSWKREDGRYAYACIRRKLAMINGELGVSLGPADLDMLPVVAATDEAAREGCRITLGHLLHGHTKAWSSGGSEKALIARLDWLAQQIHLRMMSFMAATKRQTP